MNSGIAKVTSKVTGKVTWYEFTSCAFIDLDVSLKCRPRGKLHLPFLWCCFEKNLYEVEIL